MNYDIDKQERKNKNIEKYEKINSGKNNQNNTNGEKKNIEDNKYKKVIEDNKKIKNEKITENWIRENFNQITDENAINEGYEDIKCKIKTDSNKRISAKNKKIEQSLREETQKTIAKLIKNNYIRPSNSEWNNPIGPVIKPN